MAKSIYHRHHIIPRHAGGTDEPENLVTLTISEHAEAHRLLWETHGRLGDKVAWLMLSGRTEEGEAARKEMMRSPEVRLKISNSHKGKVKTESHKAKLSQSLMGKKRSEEHCNNISKSNIGKPSWQSTASIDEIVQWKLAIANGRSERWNNTTMEERQRQSQLMNDAQRLSGSWKAGVIAAAKATKGKKLDPTLVKQRNEAQREFYQTEEGKKVLAARGVKIAATRRRNKEAKLVASAELSQVQI